MTAIAHARPGWPWLLLLIPLVYLAALGGALFPPDAWYRALVKPAWNPPAWLFGPVWTTLYLMMAVALWRVLRAQTTPPLRRTALIAFGVQWLLNAAWTPIFFGLQQPGWALLEMGLLWLAIGWTIHGFRRVDGIAAALLLPYLAWVSFAFVLNASLWWLNPQT